MDSTEGGSEKPVKAEEPAAAGNEAAASNGGVERRKEKPGPVQHLNGHNAQVWLRVCEMKQRLVELET